MDQDTIVIGGDISLSLDPLDGESTLLSEADGSPGDFYPILPKDYTGAYEFTPSMETQIAEVGGFFMDDDIIIHPIPRNYGLITWNGSFLTIS